jgi:hypothetical protein
MHAADDCEGGENDGGGIVLMVCWEMKDGVTACLPTT